MKKRIISALLVLALALNITGCSTSKRQHEPIIVTNPPVITTTTAATTTTAETTTTIATTTTTATAVSTTAPEKIDADVSIILGKTYYNTFDPPYNDIQKEYIKKYLDSIGETYPPEVLDKPAEVTKPVTTTKKPTATAKPVFTTTSKPAVTTKPDDTNETGLGSFTDEPEIDWDGKRLYVEFKRVSGADEYHLSVDSKGFTNNGDLYSKTTPVPQKQKTTMELKSSFDFALPRYVYIRITATNGKESIKKDIKYDTYFGSAYGDAKCIDGRTVIVTIFADDPTTKWTDSAADKQIMEDTWESMRCATEWLTKSAAKYGAKAEFVWDWKKYSDLKHMSSFDIELDVDELDRSHEFAEDEEWERSYAFQTIDDALKRNIHDIENERYEEYLFDLEQIELTRKYDADNIIYFYVVNTAPENRTNSFAVDKRNNDSTEYIIVYVKENGITAKANTYAHEMLHLFGAPDLYCENKVITQEYVDYLAANGCNDIMYYGQSKDNITREFTDLVAYYTGLLSYCKDVKKWGLGESDFFKGQ